MTVSEPTNSEETDIDAQAAIQTAEELAAVINWLATVPNDVRRGLAVIIARDIETWKLLVDGRY